MPRYDGNLRPMVISPESFLLEDLDPDFVEKNINVELYMNMYRW